MVVIRKSVKSSMFQVISHFVYYCQISPVIALYTFVYVARHDILCPNEIKHEVGNTCRKSDVIDATVLCCAKCALAGIAFCKRRKISSRRESFKISSHKSIYLWIRILYPATIIIMTF